MSSTLPTSWNSLEAGKRFYNQFRQRSRTTKVVTAAVVLYLVQNVFYRLLRKWKNYPPGPVGIPFFGSLLSAIRPKYAAYLASNYGSVTMFYIGNQPVVNLHTTDAIDQIRKKRNDFDNYWDKSLLYTHLKPNEYSLGICSNKYWAKKRRIFQSVIAKMDTECLNAVHNKSFEHVFQSIDNCIANDNGVWHFGEDVEYLQFHSTFNACFGSFLTFEDQRRKDFFQMTKKSLAKFSIDLLVRSNKIYRLFPRQWFVSILSMANNEFVVLMERWLYEELGYDESVFDMNERKWDKHFEEFRYDDACFASRMLALHRKNPTNGSTKYGILRSFAPLFFGGIEPTINTVELGIVLLAKFPNVQQRVYAELKAVFGGDVRMESTKFSNVINKLSNLRAFVYEVLRMSFPIPVALRTNLKRDVNINCRYPSGKTHNCVIPRGSIILCEIRKSIERDPYWSLKCNGDPTNICLDAWLDARGNFRANLNKNKMMSFGFGERICAGSTLAVRTVSLALSKLLLKYKFQQDGNAEINQAPSMRLKTPRKVRVTQRCEL